MAQKKTRVKYFSALEIAKLCGVVNQTVINWIKAGYLNAYSTPGGQFRVAPKDLETFFVSRGMHISDELKQILDKASNENNVEKQKQKSLIIVDDDKVLNTLIKSYIEKNFPSIKIYQAFDGFEAGSIMAEVKPGFVFLDLDLPGVDGFSLCKKVKTGVTFGKPYIVVVTALKDENLSERMAELGSNYFLTKPLNMDQIGAIVNQWINMK